MLRCEARDCDKKFRQLRKHQRFCSPKCRTREQGRRKSAKLKKQLLDIYGSVCQCCGEHRIEFLTLEHTDGTGAEHRRESTHAWGAWIDAIDNPDPDRFQILCMNCNWARGKYGYCPHEREND